MKIAASCSMGRPAYLHDIRETSTQNVTKELSGKNKILIDELKGRTVDQYLNELMQPAIDEYNAKQNQPCRRIKETYTDWHKKNDNKGEMVYEFVFQYGEHEDLGQKYYNGTKQEKEFLEKHFTDTYVKWLKDWQEKFPAMKVLWATIHFDETAGTPHLHTAVSPISTQFKRGPKTQISMSKCLEECGILRQKGKKEGYQLQRAFKQFREIQEADLIKMGFEIKEPKRGQHEEPEVFKEIKEAETKLKQMETLTEALQKVEEIERTPVYDPKTVKTIQHKDSILAKPEELIAMPVQTFEALKSSADAKKLNEETKAKIKAQQKALEYFKETVTQSDREKKLIKENEELKKTIKEQEKTISKIKEKYDKLRNRVIDFLRNHGLLNKFLEIFRKQDEQEKLQKLEEKQQPKFTTNLEEENERER